MSASEATLERFREYRRTGDRRVRNALVEQHMGLAEHLARRYRNRGQAADDLNQVALLGLVKAVDRFDPSRGLAFTTFATPTILGELKRHFRDRAWTVHVPRQVQEQILAVTRSIQDLHQVLGRSPTVAETARASGLSEEAVLAAMEANRVLAVGSLDAPLTADADAGTVADHIGSEESGHEAVEHRMLVASLVDVLPSREREIVRLRFYEGLSQSQIGDRLGISQMHVSRLLARTLSRLRGMVDDAT